MTKGMRRGMSRRVLICDDDPGTLQVVSAILEAHDYEPVPAGSGDEALALAAGEPPDAMLLDLFMPEKNGWETLEELKSHAATQGIPVIILSVLSPAEGEVARESYVGWVQKPVGERELLRAVEHVTGSERRPQVLVVEDNPIEARVLVSLFQGDGIDVLYAPTGTAALSIMRLVVPDLVLLDVGLPELDAFGVVERMREDAALCSLPLVVYTARDLDRQERARLELGRTEFFTKGEVELEQLERQVLRLLPVGARR